MSGQKTVIARILATACVFTLQAGNASAASGIEDYGTALVQYFKSLKGGYQPFIVSEGHQVGDVIDIREGAILKRGTVCFPKLSPPQPVKFELPGYAGMSETASSFFFELKKMVGLSANAKLVDNVALVFTEGTVEDVTLDELQKHLARECDFLKPLILDGQPVKLFGRNATLVRTIVRAKVSTVMSFGTDASAEAKIEDVKKLLAGGAASALPVDASIGAKIDLRGRKSIALKAEGPVPVAFRPTHIPKRLLGPESDNLIAFDPTNPVQIEIQDRAADAWAKSLK